MLLRINHKLLSCVVNLHTCAATWLNGKYDTRTSLPSVKDKNFVIIYALYVRLSWLAMTAFDAPSVPDYFLYKN